MHTLRPGKPVKLAGSQQLWVLGLGGVALLTIGLAFAINEQPTVGGGSAGWFYVGWLLAGVGAAMVVVVLVAIGTTLGRRIDTD